MELKLIFFYCWSVFGVIALGLFIKMAIPKVKEAMAKKDSSVWWKDSVLTHKVAELLIWIPFYFVILWSLYEPPTEVQSFVDRTDWVMIIGGLIAFYSFFDARKKYWWAYPILILALWGILGPWLSLNYVLPILSNW